MLLISEDEILYTSTIESKNSTESKSNGVQIKSISVCLQNFDKNVPEYKGIVDCCVKIFKKDGMRGFYKGLGAAYFKVFPTLAIQFWTIEILTKLSKSSTKI